MAYFSYKGKGGVAPEVGPRDLRDIVRTVPMTGGWAVPSLDTAIVSGTPDWTTIEFVDPEGHTFRPLVAAPLGQAEDTTRIARAVQNIGLWRVVPNSSGPPTVRFIPYAGWTGTTRIFWRVVIDGVMSKWGALQVDMVDTIFAPQKFIWALGSGITIEQFHAEVGPTLDKVSKFFSALLRDTPNFQQNGLLIRVHRMANIGTLFPELENALAAAAPSLYNPDGRTVREGDLYYATEYLDDLVYGRQDLENAFLHEVSHILGVSGGDMNPGRYSSDGTKYYGPTTRTTFNQITGLNLDHTPVVGKWHFAEPAGVDALDYTRYNDTMIARLTYSEAPSFSRVSASLLQDMGWTVDMNLVAQFGFIDNPNAPSNKPLAGNATGIVGSLLSGPGTGGGTAVGLVGIQPQRAPYRNSPLAPVTVSVPDTIDLRTHFTAGDSPIDWTTLFIVNKSSGRANIIPYGTTNYTGINPGQAVPYQFSITLNTPGIITSAVNPGGTAGSSMIGRVYVRDTAGRLSEPLDVWWVDYNEPTGPPPYNGAPSTIAVGSRIPIGSPFGIYATTPSNASLQLQGSPNGIDWFDRQAPTATGTQHSWLVTAQSNSDIRWRTSVVGALSPKISETRTVQYEAARTSGAPTSINGASSFHTSFWDSPVPNLTSAAVDLTINNVGTNEAFWALQTDFVDGSGNPVAGAHVGLQYWTGYPSNRAVNWGGYLNSTGNELSGSVSPLPSATNNPNTRNFLWQTGVKYRLVVLKSAPETWSAWITRMSDGAATFIRDLYVPGSVYLANYMYFWTESFDQCSGSTKSALWQRPRMANDSGGLWQPTNGALSYQEFANGGCTNTNTTIASGGIGWIQETGGTRWNHHGEYLTATHTHV